MCVITYGVRCFGCWLLEVRCMAAGYASVMKDVARTTSLIQGRIACSPAPDLQQRRHRTP